MSVTNCLIVGVGGQGILLASNLLCEAAFESGFDVKKSEVHGMSQRGGSVFSHVRWGEKVYHLKKWKHYAGVNTLIKIRYSLSIQLKYLQLR